jgi:hypothetical protein
MLRTKGSTNETSCSQPLSARFPSIGFDALAQPSFGQLKLSECNVPVWNRVVRGASMGTSSLTRWVALTFIGEWPAQSRRPLDHRSGPIGLRSVYVRTNEHCLFALHHLALASILELRHSSGVYPSPSAKQSRLCLLFGLRNDGAGTQTAPRRHRELSTLFHNVR